MTQSEIDAIKQQAEKICEHCIFSDGQLISIVEKVLTSERQRAKVLLDALRRLLPLAEDGYKLHVSNACHQEFLSEDLEDIAFAKNLLNTYNNK